MKRRRRRIVLLRRTLRRLERELEVLSPCSSLEATALRRRIESVQFRLEVLREGDRSGAEDLGGSLRRIWRKIRGRSLFPTG